MPAKTILIVDDEELNRKVLNVKLESLDYNTILAQNGLETLEILTNNQVDMIFLDIFMPEMDGFEVLKEIKKIYKEKIVVIIMTAFANLKTAVKAYKLGAFDYMIKPFTMEEIPFILNRAIQFHEMINITEKTKIKKTPHFSEIIGASDYILNLKQTLTQHITDFSSCLIQGPSGAGKKYIAKLIAKYFQLKLKDDHYYIDLLSHNKDKEQIITTLFTPDFIKELNTNVIIIDNCHLLNNSLQKLILDNLRTDVKYIFISNKEITNNNYKRYFTEDFFNFINTTGIKTIALKDHKEDIPLLIQHFIKVYNEKYDKKIKDLEKSSFYYLLYYDWPENVMELEHIIEEVVSLSESPVIKTDLLYNFIKEQQDLKLFILNPRLSYKDALYISREIIDKHYISMALKITNNNKSKAAKFLDISLRQFQYKCKELGF